MIDSYRVSYKLPPLIRTFTIYCFLGVASLCSADFVEYPSYGYNFVDFKGDGVSNDGLFGWSNRDSSRVTLISQNRGLDSYLQLESRNSNQIETQHNDFGFFRPNESDFTMTIRANAANLNGDSNFDVSISTGSSTLNVRFEEDGIFCRNRNNRLIRVSSISLNSVFRTYSFNVRDGRLEDVFVNNSRQSFSSFSLLVTSPRFIRLTANGESRNSTLRVGIDDMFVYSLPSTLNLLEAENASLNTGGTGQATHFMQLGIGNDGIPVGVNEDGGGYITQVYNRSDGRPIETSTNLGNNLDALPQFGAGSNQSVRGMMHSSRYNPVQAGISRAIGHSASIRRLTRLGGRNASNSSQTGVIMIDQFPTYNDPSTEYTENDNFDFNINGRSFSYSTPSDDVEINDFFNERAISATEEGLSELDFNGYFQERTTTNDGIPTMLSYGQWKYVRPACHILQLSREAGAIDVSDTPSRISNTSARRGLLTRDTDLGSIRIMREVRANTDLGYRWVLWRENGARRSRRLSGSFDDVGRTDESRATFELFESGTNNITPDNNVVILARTGNWNNNFAMGIHYPANSRVNRLGTVGYDRRNDNVVYEEDRRTSVEMVIDWPRDNWIRLRLLSYSRGLFSPSRVSNVYEGFRSENITIHGTPNEIFTKASNF